MVPQPSCQAGQEAASAQGEVMDWDHVVDTVAKLQALWGGINARCNYPKARSYKDYGAKGITLGIEWSGRQGCIAFVKWAVVNGYKQGLDIDRIDNSQGYNPANCRFITRQQNCWNKSNNVMLTCYDETKCSAEWGLDSRCVIPQYQFQQRIACGWSVERALTTPLRRLTTRKEHGTT